MQYACNSDRIRPRERPSQPAGEPPLRESPLPAELGAGLRPSGVGDPRAESDQLHGELPHRFPGSAAAVRGHGWEAVTVKDAGQTFQGRGLPTGMPGERVKVVIPACDG